VSDRMYLSIGEVLAQLQDDFPDITISKIRFLESQGLIDPERTPSGYRKFYDDDVLRLKFILGAQRDQFLPLKVIKDRLDAGEAGDSAAARSGGGATTAVVEAPAPTVTSAVETPGEPRVPIWMAKAAERATLPIGQADTDVSLSFDELAGASGLTVEQLRDVEQHGLITGHSLGRGEVVYDGDALLVAKLVAGFLAHGLEPRHLRSYKNGAEREAGMFEQLVLPLVKQRNPQSRVQAVEKVRALARLSQNMHDALLRQALRSYLDG
jgi:DNA-binding transcriptional MerR regulator